MNIKSFIDNLLKNKSFSKTCLEVEMDEKLVNLFTLMEQNYGIAEHTIEALENYSQNESFNYLTALAIVFHDAGKLYTASFSNGEYHFIGHQSKSVELFLESVDNFELSAQDIKYLTQLIEYHDFEVGKKIIKPIYNEFGQEFIDEFVKLKFADADAHEEPRRSARLKEIEDYSIKVNQIVSDIIKEQNLELFKQMLIERKYSIDNLKEIKELFKEFDSSKIDKQQIINFLNRYDEAKLSNMLNITNFKKTRDEAKGVTEKLWIDVDGQEALFKITQFRKNDTHTNAHYAELFVSELCNLLNISASKIELAYNAENIGCISYNFLKKNDAMIDFNEMISSIRPDFDSKKLLAVNSNDTYSIPLILEGFESVSQTESEYNRLKQSFLTYCMLYSIIEHYDVNPSNLSLIKNDDGIQLAPMFDNGTSLNLSIPKEALIENFSIEWLDEVRSNNLSKIGTNKGRCDYDELQKYILSKYYDEIKSFLDILKENLTVENINEMLSKSSYNGLEQEYKEMIIAMVTKNAERLLETAKEYETKHKIECMFDLDILKIIKDGSLDTIIPELSKLQYITQNGAYHKYDALNFTTHCLDSVNDLEISDEHKNLLKWSIIFNNAGKIDTHQVEERNGVMVDTFMNYSDSGLKIADDVMKKLNFLPEDQKIVSALIQSHKYRDLESLSTAKNIIKLFGERYLDLFFEMKRIENINKSPEIQAKTEQQLEILRKNIDNQLNFDNREIISALSIKSKNLIAMGLKGPQIGEAQRELAKYVRQNPDIYTYYKSRGHLDKYRKDLMTFLQTKLKEIKKGEKDMAKNILIINEEAEKYIEGLKKEMVELYLSSKDTDFDKLLAQKKEEFSKKFPDEAVKKVDRVFKQAQEEASKKQLLKIVCETYKQTLNLGFVIPNDEIVNLVGEMLKKTNATTLINSRENIDIALKEAFETMPKYNYRGIFVDKNSKPMKEFLDKMTKILNEKGINIPSDWEFTDDLHVTTSFGKPAIKTTYSDIGTPATIEIVGFAYNPEIGLALDVSLDSAAEKVGMEFEATQEKRHTHITIGNPEGVKAADSVKLFEANENTVWVSIDPVPIRGSYGGFTPDGKIDILSNEERLFKIFADKLLTQYLDENPYNKGLIAANNKDIGDKTVYLKSIIEQRLDGPSNAGSSFDEGITIQDALFAFATYPCKETTQEEIERGGIKPWQRCFEIPLKGKQGVISAKELADDAEVLTIDGHGVGSIEFCISGIEKKEVDTTTLISFTNDAKDCTFVVTALPGDVRSPSNLEKQGITEGMIFTGKAVKEMNPDAVIKWIPEERFLEMKKNATRNASINSLISDVKTECENEPKNNTTIVNDEHNK